MYKVLIKGPVLTRSGYGEQTRFALRALSSFPEKYEVFLEPIPWGKTGWIHGDGEERRWIDNLIKKTFAFTKSGGQFDASLQVTIPNEFTNLAPINVGYTAGMETTKVAPIWLQKSNNMNKVLVVSDHSKGVFENTSFTGKFPNGTPALLKLDTPVETVHFPVKDLRGTELKGFDVPTDFNFLSVAQWSPRKNMTAMIKWFIKEFHDDKVGLIVKTSKTGNSIMDRTMMEREFTTLMEMFPEKKCSVYLLHGDLEDSELQWLYSHEKVKAVVTTSHGEGFGLPLFEAAYTGVPVVAPHWSGQCDFLYMPVEKKGKIKLRPMFAKVDYELRPIKPEAVWKDVIIAESMWCYPHEASFKSRLREVYKDYGRFASQAKKLQIYLREEFSATKKMAEFEEEFSTVFGTEESKSFGMVI